MKRNDEILSRKNDHIRINQEEDVKSAANTGLNLIQLQHCALPEIALQDVDLSTTFLGFKLEMPLLISSMTGGTEKGQEINVNLARAAQIKKIPMGLGSQRAVFEGQAKADSFQVRKYAPDIPIFANLGAVQFNYGLTIADCQQLIDMVEANALILHLNPLQEALQPEGDTNFSDLLPKISSLCRSISIPVIIKEVGWGISVNVAARLKDAGVAAIDVAGAGGTSWSQVEMFRSANTSQKNIASHFRDWGIPTAQALLAIKEQNLGVPIIASGGLQTGIDIAKCLVLGADLCGFAGRLLHAAIESEQAVFEVLDEIERELRITLFACGAGNIAAMKNTNYTVIHE